MLMQALLSFPMEVLKNVVVLDILFVVLITLASKMYIIDEEQRRKVIIWLVIGNVAILGGIVLLKYIALAGALKVNTLLDEIWKGL